VPDKMLSRSLTEGCLFFLQMKNKVYIRYVAESTLTKGSYDHRCTYLEFMNAFE
jgi:hypothetical protein